MNRIAETALGAGLGLIAVAYLVILAPATLYIGNLGEFSVPLSSILTRYLPVLFFAMGASAVPMLLLPSRARQKYLVLLALLGLLFWIQGNLLVWRYGVLDGSAIDWTKGEWRGWLDSAVWCVCLVGGLAVSRHIAMAIVRFAIVIFVVQSLLTAYELMKHNEDLQEKYLTSGKLGNAESIYKFSSHTNVLHILADGFQSDIFEELVTERANDPRVNELFSGFTFFREHVGTFPYTHMSMPAILSGKVYLNHIPIKQHMREAVGGKTILRAARDAGYEVDIVTPGGSLRTMYQLSAHNNFYVIPPMLHLAQDEMPTYEAALLLDLSLFRLSPHFLKPLVYNDQRWFVQSLLAGRDYAGLQFFQHIAFIRNLRDNMTVERDAPVYKFLHLALSHNPMVTNKECRYAGKVLETVRETVKFQSGCALDEILRLFEKMRALGIYDDALIVLMADHGAWVPPLRLGAVRRPDGKVETVDPFLTALAMPLLAIKRPGEKHTLRISDAQSWVPDTSRTIAESLRIETPFDGRNVYELDAEEGRDRYFYFYDYSADDWKNDYLSAITEVKIAGLVRDINAWTAVRRYLPYGEIEQGAQLPVRVHEQGESAEKSSK